MGFVSEILANGSRKPIFGYHCDGLGDRRRSAFIGWIVWGHHMFMSGMQPMLGASFMLSTMVIAVPSAIKTFNWLGTMWRGDLHFTRAGAARTRLCRDVRDRRSVGHFLANTPVDIPLHDTYFVVAHIHYVLFGGSLFGIFGAITYWYPKMFGKHDARGLGQGALLPDVHLLQPDVLADARIWARPA